MYHTILLVTALIGASYCLGNIHGARRTRRLAREVAS